MVFLQSFFFRQLGVRLHVIIVPYLISRFQAPSVPHNSYWISSINLDWARTGCQPLLTTDIGDGSLWDPRRSDILYDYRYLCHKTPGPKTYKLIWSLTPVVGVCGTPEMPHMLMDKHCAPAINAIDQRRPKSSNIVLSAAWRSHQGKILGNNNI